MTAVNGLALALRFALELCALAALAVWIDAVAGVADTAVVYALRRYSP